MTFLNGGDHNVRKLIAERLLEAVEAGQHSLGELRAVGLRAFAEVAKWSARNSWRSEPVASVLLVEDELLIRMMVADMLAELGHSVAGEANDLAHGLMLAFAPGVDAAILDVQLGKESSEAIAEALQSRGIPFAFASGYGADGVPQGFKDHPVLQKPFRIEELQRCMAMLLG